MTSEIVFDTIPPIFVVKTEIDPFYLYGTLSNPQIFSETEEIEDLRLRLATLKAKNYLELKTEEREQTQSVEKPQKPVNRDKILLSNDFKESAEVDNSKYREKVENYFENIEDKFTDIFSYLLDISENPGSLVPDGEKELERVLSRSQEFNSRMKRSIFELKQQVIIIIKILKNTIP